MLPVILLEAAIAHRLLEQSWLSALKLSTWGNAVTAAIGIPLAWFLFGTPLLLGGAVASWLLPGEVAFFFAVPMYSFWLPPIGEMQSWLIPAAAAVLCIPCAVVSAALELWVGRKVQPGTPADRMRSWAWRANFASYTAAAVALLAVALLVYVNR